MAVDFATSTCSHPLCGTAIQGEPVFGRLSLLPYCSAECRRKDGPRRRQAARRAADPQGVAEYTRWNKIGRKYGLSREDFERLWEEQEGRCAICGVDLTTVKVCVDHDHETSEVRGLLCNTDNQGLGYFADSPDRLMAAAGYLLSRAPEGR